MHSLESSIYGAYIVACIAQKHTRLAQRGITITTLPSSPWNLWKAILTGAGLQPLSYSIAHALTLMAKSLHPNIVAKVCGSTKWMNVAWSRLGGGHYLNDNNFAPILVHLAELVLQVKICLCKPSSDQAWELKELTWMSTGDLTPVHAGLLPTIDPRLAHKTELIAEITKSLDYCSAEEWYKAGMQATQQRLATLPLLPKPAATPQLFAASHFSIVSHEQLQTSTTQPHCLLTTNIKYATVRAIPLGMTSRIPVHDQAWAFAGGLTKHNKIFYNYVKYEPTKVANKMALPLLIAHRLRQARSKLTHELGKAKHVKKAVKLWEAHSAQLMRVVTILHEAVQSQHTMQQGPQPPSDYVLRVKAEHSPPASPGDEAADAALRAKATKRPPTALEIPVYGTYPNLIKTHMHHTSKEPSNITIT